MSPSILVYEDNTWHIWQVLLGLPATPAIYMWSEGCVLVVYENKQPQPWKVFPLCSAAARTMQSSTSFLVERVSEIAGA